MSQDEPQAEGAAEVLDRDLKRVETLALSRMSQVEIAALLGRPLTAREVFVYHRARGIAKLRAKAKKDSGPKTGAERLDAHRLRHKMIPWQECADPARRARLEKKPKAWLRFYLANAFTRPFGDAHDAIIDGAINAQETRGRFVVAAERGIGKSTLLWALVLMFALTGRERFPVCVMWSEASVGRALRFWKNALAFNERLLADYPEFCLPYSWAKGAGGRLSGSLWQHNQVPTGAMLQLGECMIILPDNRGAIGCETINGNPRGLNHPTPDGSILRPTLVLIDDPQSRAVAASPIQTGRTIEVIDGDIAGLGEAGTTLPMLMSGNCIHPGDVMDHYLSNDEWRGVRISRITSWPENFNDPQSASRKLWEEWNRVRIDGSKERDRGASAIRFYKRNKAGMIIGMTVSNTQGFDKAKGQPDALYGSMESYYTLGHAAFMAERQQQPVVQTSTSYELRIDTILKRTSGFARLHAPAGSVIVMGIDINFVGFNWAVIAADPTSQSRKIVAHGLWPPRGGLIPRGATDALACSLIRQGIGKFTREVMEPMRVNCGGGMHKISSACWDASNGKWQDAIAAATRECQATVQQFPLKAFGSKTYRPRRTDLRQGKGWHISQFPRIGKVLVVNSDQWRELMQRGFVVESSEQGALSIYTPDDGENRELAMQIVGERLVEKVVTDKGEYYSWTRTPGVPNDRSDAVVYACALTGFEGVGEEKFGRARRKVYKQADLSRSAR